MKNSRFGVIRYLGIVFLVFMWGGATAQTLTVDLRDLPPGTSLTLQFAVTINDTLPSNVSEISNQGTVTGSNFSSVLTDDPDTPAPGDPTRTDLFQPPVPSCQSVIRLGQVGSLATVSPESLDSGSFDPDGGPLTFALAPPGPYPVGSTPVSLIVTDDELDSASCQAVIVVIDPRGPLFPAELIMLLEGIHEGSLEPNDVVDRIPAWYLDFKPPSE